MIPKKIIRAGKIHHLSLAKRPIEEKVQVRSAFERIGLDEEDQIGEYLLGYYFPWCIRSGAVELINLISPTEQIYETTEWAREIGLPEEYITLTSGEGEGFYLYNKDDKKVYDELR